MVKRFCGYSSGPEALAEKLTMAGLEVKAIDRFEDDFVFEIEITSNRPDWLSVIGVAREVAALTGKKLRVTRAQERKSARAQVKSEYSRAVVIIEDKKACPLYSARGHFRCPNRAFAGMDGYEIKVYRPAADK